MGAKVLDKPVCGSDPAGLLPETFVHIAGIGTKTERRLWQSGIGSWEELRATSFGLRPQVLKALDDSAEALANEDVDYFFSNLPAKERWRTFADFGDQFVAVDIESTGMSIYDQITVIGIERAGEYRTFIQGSNLADAAELLNDAAGLITFNGALFDLPFLQRVFPEVTLPKAHVDLRFLARRIGLAGSLKSVEQQAALQRESELEDISGYGATVLWSCFDYDGDLSALEKLVLYNAADTCVLRPLAEMVTDQLLADLYTDREEVPPTLFSQDPEAAARQPQSSLRVAPLPEVTRTQRSLQVGSVKVKLPSRRGSEPTVTLDALHQRMADPGARIVGIDLTGSESRPTGWALLEGDLVTTGMLYTDEEIIRRTLESKAKMVSIDSPLSLPKGRDCTDDSCECRAVGGIMRHCERELKGRGVNVYPSLIQSMQKLTARGIRLAKDLREAGVEVIESYPGAAQDIMRIPRKRASQERLRAGLERFGVRGIRRPEAITHDELDAVTSAVVGVFYLADAFEALGIPEEDYLIVPSIGEEITLPSRQRPSGPPPRLVIVKPAEEEIAIELPAHPKAQVVDSMEAFDALLARDGAKTRGFRIVPAGERLSRRPSLFDDHRHADAPDLIEAMEGWMKKWEGSST